MITEGGVGSGNFGHKGRPGFQGGSGQGLPDDATAMEFLGEELNDYIIPYHNHPKEYITAVEFYCGEGYDSVNRYFREGHIPTDYFDLKGFQNDDDPEFTTEIAVTEITNTAKALDSIIQNTPKLESDKVVFRYINNFPFSEGETFVDKGYVSTSFDSNLGANVIRYGGMKTEIRIKLPKGSRFAVLSQFDVSNQAEGEILLPRNSKFRVTKVWGETATIPHKHVDLELIP